MLTLRCTRKLLARRKQPAGAGKSAPATTLLGDWYANLLVVRREHLVLFVAEKTLLPVVVRASPLDGLVPRFRLATRAVLLALGVAEPLVEREVAAMELVHFGKTRSRQVLGSMTDFAVLAEAGKPKESLVDLSRWLAEAPCRPLRMESPREATVALLAARWP